MTASRTIKIDNKSPLARRIRDRLQSRWQLASRSHSNQHHKWQRAEEMVMAYMPEQQADRVRSNRRGLGEVSYTTIQIPYAYAQLMSAHTYWTSVFFARTPVHQYSGRHGEAEMQVQALEALVNYQIEVGGALPVYYIWLYDAGKYGFGVLGTYWDKELIEYGQIVEVQEPDGTTTLAQATEEVEGYQGNRCYNVSPWDFFPDPRVQVKRFQDGEFVFVRRRLGWNHILRRRNAGYYHNIEELKSNGTRDPGGHWTNPSRIEGAAGLERPDFNMSIYEEDTKDGKKIEHPSGATLLECYIDLIPNEWGLGSSTNPQKWCITVTEDMQLILGCSPLGYMHGRFPFDIAECEIEGYGTFTRGLPETMEPIQNTMDWLLNSHFYNVRAAMNNQFLVDPSKVVIKDVKNSGPGFLWRLRPEAYGTDIRSMFMQVPVQDVTKGHLSDIQMMMGMAERQIGVNDQIMGAMNTGGRKTATEVRTSTGFGVNRMKTISEYMSASAFGPHSQKLVQTSQQCYDARAKLKRVGSLMVDAGQQFIDVDPEAIAGFYDFVPVDGALPVDRMAQANLWKEILMALPRMPPQVAMSYDISKIFAFTAQLGGLKNIHQFKVQVLPPGVAPTGIPMGQPGGNVVSLPRPGGGVATSGNSASTAAGLNALAPQ